MNTSTETLVRESEITELSNEELGLRIDCVVRATVQNLADLKPLIEEAWRRLEAGQIFCGGFPQKKIFAPFLGQNHQTPPHKLFGGKLQPPSTTPQTPPNRPLFTFKT